MISGAFLIAKKFGKGVSKLAASFIVGFNLVALLVTLGLQRFDQLHVGCSDLPKNTPMEQDELRVSPCPLETWLRRLGRVSHGARESRCGFWGSGGSASSAGFAGGGAAAQKGAVAQGRGLRGARAHVKMSERKSAQSLLRRLIA